MSPQTWGALLGTEWLKLRTVRLPAWLPVVAVGLTLALALQPVLAAGRNGSPSIGTVGAELAVLDATGRGPLLALVLGVVVVAGEHQHATVTPSLLQTPARARLLVAKAAIAALGALALGLLSLATALAVGWASGAVRPDLLNSDIVWRAAGLLLAHPAYALLGSGFGALLHRSQPAAVLVPLTWLLFGESMLLTTVDRHLLPWGLVGVTEALANSGDVVGVLPVWAGGALLLAWAATAAAGGALAVDRRDIA